MTCFHEQRLLQKVGVALIVKSLNPIFCTSSYLSSTDNQLNQEQMEHVQNNKLELYDISCMDHIQNTLIPWLKQHECHVYYSQVAGFGIYCASDIFDEKQQFEFPELCDFESIESEIHKTCRFWVEPSGKVLWTFGLSSLINHSCAKHSNLQCWMTCAAENKITTSFQKTIKDDPILT